MPIVKLSISDWRLPVGRQLSVIVRCVRPAKVGHLDSSAIETVAIVERGPTTPIAIELAHGTWCIFVKSAYFSESVEVITVPDTIHDHAVDLVIGKAPDQRKLIKLDAKEDAHPYGLLPRSRLAPSRGTSSSTNRVMAKSVNRDMFLVKFFDYNPKRSGARIRFSEARNFDGRMKYWMSDWLENEPYRPTEIWPSEKSNDVRQNLSILNLKLDLSKTVEYQSRRKALLTIKFFDQAFSVVLPQAGPYAVGKPSPLVLEISFVDESVSCAKDVDRLRGVRLHTTDPNFDAVTQFLADGEMPNALKIWKILAEKMLLNKYEDPVAAAAASLIFVHASMGAALPVADKVRWESWMHTLRNDFSTISDGAVGDAWINALRPGEQHSQMVEASRAFQLAVHCGLPIFTEAVRLLKRGAEWAFENDRNSDELIAIRWLTQRVIPGTALTTIRHEET